MPLIKQNPNVTIKKPITLHQETPIPPYRKNRHLKLIGMNFRLNSDNGKYLLGLFFVLCVALIWQCASYIVQFVESGGLPAFILTYLSNSLFIILLPISKIKYVISYLRGCKSKVEDEDDSIYINEDNTKSNEEARLVQSGNVSTENNNDSNQLQDRVVVQGSEWQTIKAALVVSPLWFLGQYTNNLALNLTSVSSNTILSTPASLFTFILAVFLVNEKFEMRKLLSIVVCMLGVIMVTVVDMEMSKDQNGTNGGVVGDLVTILSAFFYASYTVAIRMMLGDDSESDMAAFFGYVGLINAVALLPVLIVCLATGAIVMANISRSSLLWVATKGLLDNVLADYLWARAVLLIGPTIATVGLSIQVPLSLVVDPMMGTPVWATDPMSILVTILGATLVLLGFYSINLEKPFSFCNVNARRAQ
eukprot:TRINITY_DN7416_c0_g3_i1.p1 TRINITY_DN7416_c0_g3~~TRINITY_DN7416_c0_g3_i1.p1  ORF type:complete len:420 (+),score=27.89 TRINITY_DN7416_c0_g3_i1:40-1299(+)